MSGLRKGGAQGRKGRAAQVIIQPLKRDDIGFCSGNGIDYGSDLRIAAFVEGMQQQPRPFAGQFGIVGADTKGLRGCGNSQRKGNQTGCNEASSSGFAL